MNRPAPKICHVIATFWMLGICGFVLPSRAADLVAVDDLGVRIAPGFRVTLYADSNLANDIYAMTLDARGRVVVTSQGYIKILHDTNGDGRADLATLFATTQTGGMGLCFDGNDLYFSGDGFLSVYRDVNGDGVADGPPDKLVPLHFAEHGGHAMRKGPDGWWYVIGGNETGFNSTNHITLAGSPIRAPEAGAIMRISSDGMNSEIIAHGLRNPYDFDFNPLGEMFTYDSDVESDFFLPWYTLTRIYQVGYGQHHGWRLPGWTRSWNRPDYYPDAVSILWPVGRGSPTGVVCYRHTQFPEHYRNGLFALDWTFGKIYFFPLTPDGSTYRTQPELFLEPIGTHGFAPTDAVVAPDGSLFVSIGGRKTRGAVYRIEFPGAAPSNELQNSVPKTTAELDSVLLAPQPLEAWSRARWVPTAQRIGAERIGQTLSNVQLNPELRVRAIEVLTELFNGLATQEAALAMRDASPFVRARVAWSLGRAPCENYVPILLPLALDQHPLVRRCALEAIADRAAQLNPTNLLPILPVNLAHPDKRVRQAAARLAKLLPEASWTKLWTSLEKAVPQARLTAAMAVVWRNPESQIHTNTLKTALAVLKSTRDNDLRLQAIRLIILALGDYHLNDPSVEVYTSYELAAPLKNLQTTVSIIQNEVRPIFGSGHSLLDAESARLLGMLEDKDTNLVRQVAEHITPRSHPTYDFHYLVVLSRLPGGRSAELTGRIAHAILSLDRKLEGHQQRAKQNWSVRLSEVVTNLIKRDLQLPEALLKHPDFARPAHVDLVSVLDAKYREQAARLFLAAVKKTPAFPWSGPLIELLSSLPAEEVRSLFRQQWSNFALRDELLLKLAVKPEPIDREKFLFGLTSSQIPIVRTSLAALAELPRDPSLNNLIPAFHLLRRLLTQTNETALRTNIIALVARQTGQPFKVEERETDAASLKKVYQSYFAWFLQKNPQLRQAVESESDGDRDSANWNQALKAAKWDLGQPVRGERIFVERGCQTCHTGTSSLGPDLAGVAGRFSAEDLFTAIIYPNRDVAPQYRTTVFKTRDGQTHTGIVSFESADGVIVLTGAASAVRLAEADIVARYPGNLSLMPSGLLNGLRPEQLADLYSYLKTLTPKSR